jgi:hypothetical protein
VTADAVTKLSFGSLSLMKLGLNHLNNFSSQIKENFED